MLKEAAHVSVDRHGPAHGDSSSGWTWGEWRSTLKTKEMVDGAKEKVLIYCDKNMKYDTWIFFRNRKEKHNDYLSSAGSITASTTRPISLGMTLI